MPNENQPAGAKSNKWALASFKLGVFSLLLAIIFFAILTNAFQSFEILNRYSNSLVVNILIIALFICSIFAILFGCAGLKKKEDKMLALSGIILGIFLLLLLAFMSLLTAPSLG